MADVHNENDQEPTLTLAELNQLVRGETTVRCRLGLIRLERISMQTKLRLLRMLDSFERSGPEKELSEADAFTFGLDLVAASAVEPSGAILFAGEAGKKLLARLDPDDLSPLIKAAASLNGFDISKDPDPN